MVRSIPYFTHTVLMYSVAECRDGRWSAHMHQVPLAIVPFVYNWYLFWLAKVYLLIGCTIPVAKCFEYQPGWINEWINEWSELISSFILTPILFGVFLPSHLRISEQVYILFILSKILPLLPLHQPQYSICVQLPTKSEDNNNVAFDFIIFS